MYNIKDVINRLKEIATIDSNTQLATLLNVSYNTLNTWIKRGKLPQEVLIEFTQNYDSSLDYILFGSINKQNNSNLFSNVNTNTNLTSFRYYGAFEELGIGNKGANLKLNINSLHSNAYYLLNIDNLYTISNAIIDIFNKEVKLVTNTDSKIIISLEKFNSINLGMIIEISI